VTATDPCSKRAQFGKQSKNRGGVEEMNSFERKNCCWACRPIFRFFLYPYLRTERDSATIQLLALISRRVVSGVQIAYTRVEPVWLVLMSLDNLSLLHLCDVVITWTSHTPPKQRSPFDIPYPINQRICRARLTSEPTLQAQLRLTSTVARRG
jgi:hypothetical protein